MLSQHISDSKASVIIGNGEVGKALYKVLDEHYIVFIRDKIGPVFPNSEEVESSRVEILHICIPFSRHFVKIVKQYKKDYDPEYTVIHSTVPVGISRKCGAIHSPVRGMHPEMENGLKTYVKFLGGKDASEVADYFRRANFKIQLCEKQETTELAKILSTTRYGIDIEFAKDTAKLCRRFKVPFSEVYTLWTLTYNKGLKKKGEEELCRPVIQPIEKKIGGHCVLPNAELLKTRFTEFLKK